MRLSLVLLAAVGLASSASAQLEPAKPNLIGDTGGFEKASEPQDNLWDGVDGDGFLRAPGFNAQVVKEGGNVAGLAMPPSVAFADLNGDGKPDLITADPTGFFRFYPNVGTAAAPRFTSAEIIPLFVSTTFRPRRMEWEGNDHTDDVRFCPRFALADWRHSGLLDLLIGNYLGEILFVPNSGTARQPIYRLAGDIERARLPTHDQGRLWGNLLSPAACDWNGDGKLDLLVGEGTYSANSVHRFENLGGGTPKFSEAKHSYAAYGDGREQLIPTVADCNGDGRPDLIVADRTGEVGIYLNPGPSKPGAEFPRSATVTFGGVSKLPGLCSVYAADYNGDGLFDLLVGQPNGKVAVALNTGTRERPAFGPLQEIKGADRLARTVRYPVGWDFDTWSVYGNALAYFRVVNAQEDPASQPPEGANCLKAGYWPAVQPNFPMPADGMPGAPRHFTLIRKGIRVETNKSYTLSFKVKAAGMAKMTWFLRSGFHDFTDVLKMTRDERGGVTRNGDFVNETVSYDGGFNAGPQWTTVTAKITPRYKNPALRDEKSMSLSFYVDFWADNLASTAYFDDFRLVED